MTEIGSASIAYCLVLFLVCLLLLMLFFCEFGRNRDEMTTNSSSKASVLTIVVPIDGYKSKLLRHREEPWPLRDISRKDKLKTATGNFELKTEELTNSSLEIMDGNESEISQPDRIYARS